MPDGYPGPKGCVDRPSTVLPNDTESEAGMRKVIVSHERADPSLGGLGGTYAFAQRAERRTEMNISGTDVLVAVAIVLCLGGSLVWTLLRYWLFAP